MKNIKPMEDLMSTILMVIAPQQYHSGLLARKEILKEGSTAMSPEFQVVARSWPSVFTGISIISNRETPPHRDRGSSPQDFDLLSSLGTHSSSQLEIHDVGRRYSYQPGVVVGLCGRVLQHSVSNWSGGERICYARFMKEKVLLKLNCPKRDWVTADSFKP